MPYEPRSLSYADGLEEGARRERRRILDLMMSDAHYNYTDMHDTASLRKFSELVDTIESPDNAN